MRDLIQKFLNLIEYIENKTGNSIKIVSFDFDCTLIPFHTGGAFPIYDKENKLKPDVINKFFPEADWIRLLVIALVESERIPAICSHSDMKFVPSGCEELGYRGGIELIQPLLSELIPGEIFQSDNIIAFSRKEDDSYKNKNLHITELLTNLNNKLKTNYQRENVLLIDDTITNVLKADGYQCLFSDYKTIGLSFGSKFNDLYSYLDMLKEQVDIQIKEKYGFNINVNGIDNNKFNIGELELPGKPWMYILPVIGLAVGAKLLINKN